MSTDEFLTRDERAALMEVVSKKPRGSSVGASAFKEGAHPYDLASQDYAINSLLPVLDTIHVRFAHRLRIGLYLFQQHAQRLFQLLLLGRRQYVDGHQRFRPGH